MGGDVEQLLNAFNSSDMEGAHKQTPSSEIGTAGERSFRCKLKFKVLSKPHAFNTAVCKKQDRQSGQKSNDYSILDGD